MTSEAIIEHAKTLGISLSYQQARGLALKHQHPCVALSMMAEAETRRRDAQVIDLERWRTNNAA